MAKKIQDENGNVYVQKKPIYKRVWFIALVLIVVVIIAVQTTGGSKKDANTNSSTSESNNSSASSSSSEQKNSNEATLGTPITFDKEAEITVKTAAWTDERNQIEKSNPKKVLLVTYDIKNLSDKDYAVGTELKLYVNGKKAESYPIQVTFDSISPNRVLENATQAFAVNEDGDLELEVQPMFSFKDKKIIKLDLK